ncbi:hypothetical protein D3C75_987150 [compost metagenome]
MVSTAATGRNAPTQWDRRASPVTTSPYSSRRPEVLRALSSGSRVQVDSIKPIATGSARMVHPDDASPDPNKGVHGSWKPPDWAGTRRNSATGQNAYN